MPSLRLAVVTQGLVIPLLVARSRGLVMSSLVARTRGVISSLRLVAPTRGLVVPPWRLFAPRTQVVHGHCLGALVLESRRVVARLKLAPARRPRRAAAAIVGAGAWTTHPTVAAAVEAQPPPVPGVRSSEIFVIARAAVAPPPVHVTAVAAAAPRLRLRPRLRLQLLLVPRYIDQPSATRPSSVVFLSCTFRVPS